jgi:hypothetical protein
MSLISVENNTCSICHTKELLWNLDYSKTQMEMFKCGHGTCKQCYRQMQLLNIKQDKSFSCPKCGEPEQQYRSGRLFTNDTKSWTTFAEWYADYHEYIKLGLANNVVKNTVFGKQLLRIMKEVKSSQKKEKLEKSRKTR